MPLCHMSFYLAAHQPPKSLCAYIIFLLGRNVCQNVLNHLIQVEKTQVMLLQTVTLSRTCDIVYRGYVLHSLNELQKQL